LIDGDKYNIGCGDDLRPGYINVDSRDIDAPVGITFVKSDVFDSRLVRQTEVAQEVIALDVLEHAPYAQTFGILTRWVGMLIPGGLLLVQTPSLERIISKYCDGTHKGRSCVEKHARTVALLFGGQNYPGNTHYTCHTRQIMEHMFSQLPVSSFEIQVGGFGNDCNMFVKAWKVNT